MRSIALVFILAVFHAAVAVAGGTEEGMRFLDVRRTNRDDAQLRFALVDRVRLGDPLSVRTADRGPELAAFEQPVVRLDLEAADFVPFQSGIVGLSGTDRVVQLPLGTNTFDLAIVDVTFDPSFNIYHVAAIVLGTEEGHARFTVDLKEDLVVGTVYAMGQAWRITPADGSGGHLARPIKRPAREGLRNDTSSVSRPGSSLSALEARHVQMLRIAEIAPRRFRTIAASLVAITGEEIERVNLSEVLNGPGSRNVNEDALKTELTAAFERMRPLTLHYDSLELAVRSAAVGGIAPDAKLVVRVSQIINEIPVEPTGVITVDLPSGKITDFAMTLVPPGTLESDRIGWLSNEDAVALAHRAIASEFGTTLPTISHSELQYVRRTDGAIGPEWLLYFSDNGTSYEARIDAITGESRAYERATFVHQGFQKICTANGQPGNACAPNMPNSQAGQDTTPGYWKVIDRDRWGNGNPLCYPTSSPCSQRHLDGFNTVEQMEGWVEGAGGPPLGPYAVRADTPGQGFPGVYDNGTQTIVLPPTGEGGFLPGVDPLSPAARQVVYHELAHHHQNVYGPSDSGHAVLTALKEGLADAAAALQTNDDWVLYDGILEEGFVRDLTAPQQISDWGGSAHQNGMIFTHIIYKLSGMANISDAALSNLVLGTYRQVTPDRAGDPAVYDMGDVYEAMRVVAAVNPYLYTALEEVWIEMDGTPSNNSGEGGSSGGVPPATGAPAPPSYVDGYFLECLGPGLALHRVSWMNIFNATFYEIFYSIDHGASYHYIHTTNTPPVEIWNTADVRIHVKACNSAGCSWLSNDFYFQTMVLC